MAKKKGKGCLIAIGILVALGVIGAIFGDKNAPNTANNTTSEQQQQKKYGIGDKVSTKKLEFTVLSTDKKKSVSTDDSGVLSYTADGNGIYFIVEFKVKNISGDSISLDSSGFKLVNGDVKYSPSMLFTDEAANIYSINAGMEVTKKLYFEIPEDTNVDKLRLVGSSNIFSDTDGIEIELTPLGSVQ
jgi:hypothetical protein